MDCGRDFVGDDYATHTSCVTEAEKYQGDLFKGEKGGVSKGEKKQQEWLEVSKENLYTIHLAPPTPATPYCYYYHLLLLIYCY